MYLLMGPLPRLNEQQQLKCQENSMAGSQGSVKVSYNHSLLPMSPTKARALWLLLCAMILQVPFLTQITNQPSRTP